MSVSPSNPTSCISLELSSSLKAYIIDGFVGTLPQIVSVVFVDSSSSGNPFSYIFLLSLRISSEIFPKLMYKSPTWFWRSCGFIPDGKPSELVIE